MIDWRRKSPLHDTTAVAGRLPELLLRELPHCGKLQLQARGDIESVRRAAARAIGQDLPVEPNTSTGGAHRVLWLGPLKWLIVLDPAILPETRRRLREALSPHPCLVADVSDARLVTEVNGDRARSLRAGICPLDLDEASFGPGRCAQSLLVRIPLLLHRVDSRPCFHLYVDRSFARYAWGWLSDAAVGLAAPQPGR